MKARKHSNHWAGKEAGQGSCHADATLAADSGSRESKQGAVKASDGLGGGGLEGEGGGGGDSRVVGIAGGAAKGGGEEVEEELR